MPQQVKRWKCSKSNLRQQTHLFGQLFIYCNMVCECAPEQGHGQAKLRRHEPDKRGGSHQRALNEIRRRRKAPDCPPAGNPGNPEHNGYFGCDSEFSPQHWRGDKNPKYPKSKGDAEDNGTIGRSRLGCWQTITHRGTRAFMRAIMWGHKTNAIDQYQSAC